MPAHETSAQLSSEPCLETSDDQTLSETYLTPSHAFPPSADSGVVDPNHARASLSKSHSTDGGEHHHHVEKKFESCASCRSEGKKPFQGHADREEGCTCMIGEGAVPAGGTSWTSAWYALLTSSLAVLER